MKLITTVYQGAKIELTLVVQSRNARNRDDINGPLVTKYRSKVGNESLIFNPSIAFQLKPSYREGGNDNNRIALIPMNVFYRFTAALRGVYESLASSKLYHMDGGTLFIDKKIAMEKSRGLSLFKSRLSIVPSIVQDYAGNLIKGIDFMSDRLLIGSVTHIEAINMIDLTDHFDMITFSLLAGVVDEMESVSSRLDRIESKIDLILSQTKKEDRRSSDVHTLNWTPIY